MKKIKIKISQALSLEADQEVIKRKQRSKKKIKRKIIFLIMIVHKNQLENQKNTKKIKRIVENIAQEVFHVLLDNLIQIVEIALKSTIVAMQQSMKIITNLECFTLIFFKTNQTLKLIFLYYNKVLINFLLLITILNL